ncbi:MAG: hypothetical protein P1U74_01010 [Legionellaceae bacterium]|nr:hypothetical protein [Legionellaceae bacterium]
MNIKRFVFASLALTLLGFSYDFIVHTEIIKGIYPEKPSIFRSFDQRSAYGSFNIIMVGFLCFWITFVFSQFYKDGGWRNGAKFGFYLGVLSGLYSAGIYYLLPISGMIPLYWFIFHVIKSTTTGLVIGILYKNQ